MSKKEEKSKSASLKNEQSSQKTRGVAVTKTRSKTPLIIALILATAIAFSALGAIVWLSGAKFNDKTPPATDTPITGKPIITDGSAEIIAGFPLGTTKATQSSEYLNTDIPRNVPTQTADLRGETGVAAYPTYGSDANKPTSVAEKDSLVKEAMMLNAYTTVRPGWYSEGVYDALDKDGYLLRNGEKVSDGAGGYKKLFKHVASNGMYYGNVADDEPAISKKLTFISRTGRDSNQITGIYAPAGEVIKIEMSDEDFKATGGLMVYIGQAYNNGQLVQVETSGDYGIKGYGYRMWYICNTYETKSATAYVGSYLGGPIYIRPMNNSVSHKFSVTITGGVRYQHFILGVTTPEEYALNAKSSAPYFDLEIYDNALRFSGSNKDVKNKTYEDCVKSAVLWEKIALTSTRVQGAGNDVNVPIVAIFDCYVAAGVAFANPGRNGIVCPTGWMAGALDYESFVTNGAWGMMHEYNHCWQSYGLPGGSERVNNGVTLVEYMLYTKISSQRRLNQQHPGDWWNRLTDPSWALKELLEGTANSTSPFYEISLYASLLYNIGAENYIGAAYGGKENNAVVYYSNLTNNAHYDFTWFFTDLLHYGIGEGGTSIPQAKIDEFKSKNYPVFVPVSSVYAVGRNILCDGQSQYIEIAQPFEYVSYAANGEYVMDFGNRNNFKSGTFKNSGLVIPDGFSVRVKNVTQPTNGSVQLLEDNKLKYTPSSELYSGEFKVTLEITKDDGAFEVDDVVFTVNLKQSNLLNRTTYVYENAQSVPKYNELINSATNQLDFGTYKEKESIQHINSTQNCNTDMWTPNSNYYDASDLNKKRDFPVNSTVFQTVSGVLYFPDAGTYRISVRGRGKIALYISYDKGETWELAVDVNNDAFGGTDWMGHKELKEFTGGGNAVYFTEVLLLSSNRNFFGLGTSKKNADGTYGGISYANAYRNGQTASDAYVPFESDYFFKKTYTFNYSNIQSFNEKDFKDATVIEHNGNNGQNSIDKLFDNDLKTVYHSMGILSESTPPWEFTVDLGKEITAHTLELYSQVSSGKRQTPNTLKLYVGTTKENLKEVASLDKESVSGLTVSIQFERQTFRYFKLSIKSSVDNHFASIGGIVFKDGDVFENGIQLAPSADEVSFTGNGWKLGEELSSFGHIYEGEQGDKICVEFTGERVAYLACKAEKYGAVDIYIDDKLVAEGVSLNGDGKTDVVFISEALSSGDHVLTIVGKSGKFNLDSFVYWKK